MCTLAALQHTQNTDLHGSQAMSGDSSNTDAPDKKAKRAGSPGWEPSKKCAAAAASAAPRAPRPKRPRRAPAPAQGVCRATRSHGPVQGADGNDSDDEGVLCAQLAAAQAIALEQNCVDMARVQGAPTTSSP